MNRRKTLSLGLVSGTLLAALPARPQAQSTADGAVRALLTAVCSAGKDSCSKALSSDRFIKGATVKLPPELLKLDAELAGQACRAIESYYARLGYQAKITVDLRR